MAGEDKSTRQDLPGDENINGENVHRSSEALTTQDMADLYKSISLQRHSYILQQINSVNENVYKFLAIYQTLATLLAGGGVALFVNYRHWGIAATAARRGIISLMAIITLVAFFAIIFVIAGVRAWIDYRLEECELTDKLVYPGYRRPPSLRNFTQWYETYIVIFIASSVVLMWLLAITAVLPALT